MGITWDFPAGTILTYALTAGFSAAFALVWMRRDVTEVQGAVEKLDESISRLANLMTKHEEEDHKRFGDVRSDIVLTKNEIRNDIESARDSAGEVGAALRQKVSDVEIWARDTFIRRDSFREVMADHRELLQRLEAKIDQARTTQMGRD